MFFINHRQFQSNPRKKSKHNTIDQALDRSPYLYLICNPLVRLVKFPQPIQRAIKIAIAACLWLALPIKPSMANDYSYLPRSYIGTSELLTAEDSPLAIGDTFKSFSELSDYGDRVMPNITGRLKMGSFSLRTSLLVNETQTALVPALSFDLPVGQFTNVYVGAGGLIRKETTTTGDRHSRDFALQPGAEMSLNRNLLLYGNLVIPFDRQWQVDQTRTSIQGGIGIQF
ncbi:hypothetical protein Pse7367_0218 [Thalassoporum mexicanum PCC 7367]|uniref:hypothetical protein n=1 Tax=Thalassoporum mexicanum TaxID=3457544 RepID=UPI00029FD89E|nr:hypothetical protein [Pseudanabaena sp. PCC 7367]AFY68535.1 hypothetical protein Pse7367_0218 [Pseudanabaena sp. PCC 7367]